MVKLAILRQHWDVWSSELVTIVCFPLASHLIVWLQGNNVYCVNIFFIIRVSSYRKGYFNLSYICSSPPPPWSFRKSWGKGENYFMALPLNPMSVREVHIYVFIAHTNNSSGSPGLWTLSKLIFFFCFFIWIRCDRTSVRCLYFHKTWSRANK
jgi:hypothetical protein